MRISLAAFLLASLLLASPSFSEPKQLTPRQRHLIDELMEVTHVDQLSIQMFDATMAQMQTGAFDQKGFQRFRELARQRIDFSTLVREIYATVYIRYFTDEDLEAMIAFDKTPTGQKAIMTMPKVMTDVMTAAQARVMPEIMEIYKQIDSEEKEEQTTKGDLQKISRALNAWLIGEDGGYPRAADINDLAKQLQPYAREFPTKDIWGHSYAYAVSDDRNHYRIVSAGSDGTLERDSLRAKQESAITPHYSEGLQNDIIFGDGHFIALPKAWQLTELELRNNSDAKQPAGSPPPPPSGEALAPKITMAAERGDASGQEELGHSYELNGDFVQAVKWYRKAADQGFSVAQDHLGDLYRRGDGVPKDASQAALWYRKAADQDYSPGQNDLADLYRSGEGVTRDPVQAVKWYRKAAESGYMPSQITLALLYASGEGVVKDDVEAAKWTQKAAEQGDAASQSNLGAMYGDGKGVNQDFAEEVKWYRKAADQGLATAQFNLAYSYEIGEGVTKDLATAAAWYRKAADQGFPQAQFNLGNAYRDGAGVRQDFAEALTWYRKAADQQYAPAIVNIGVAYQQGEGVTKDSPEAIRWYRKAAALDSANAQYLLGTSYATGDGVPADPDEAASWYRKAAAQGVAEFQYAFGMSLLSGDGVKKDESEGRVWLQKAGEQGHAKAKEMLSKPGRG